MRLPIVGLAVIGIVQAASAGEPGLPWLRGASAYGPGTPNVAPAPPPARPHDAPPPDNFSFEVGARYWLSSGKLTKDLYDDPRASGSLNSRLTYDGLRSGTFEGYGRLDTAFGTFIKGYAGFSGLGSGSLKDEDFPPNTQPYSSTTSPQGGGRLTYGVIDVGQIAVTTERARVSVLVGYGHLDETMNAFGCTQTAGNPQICVPSVAASTLSITEETHWDYARLGFLGEVKLLDRLTLSGEFAWLPYLQINGLDTHWLRLGSQANNLSGPISESGYGTGVQLETILSYQVTDCLNLGIGGRYWYLQTRGGAELERVIVGLGVPAVAQPLNFTTTRYGGFVQGAYRFGPF